MGVLHIEDAKRLAKRLKRILRDEFGEEIRLGRCQHVMAEAFDFDDFAAMVHTLPAEAEWNREWCINALHDDGHVGSEAIAVEGVARLEAALGFLIKGRAPRVPEDGPASLHR